MIFVDTSFWLALAMPRDVRHATSVTLYERFGGSRLVTSNHVRGETWTFLRRRVRHRVAVHFLDSLQETSRIRLDFVAPELEEEALVWLRRHDEREYSFVDATSFALMRRERIREALGFDSDFTAAGFVEARP